MPSASLIKEFEQLVGKENVFSSEADRQSYAYDAAVLKPMIPSLVVRPTEVEQLGQVVKRCYEEGIPMTVRGSGTNLTGGTIPDCSDTIVILTTGLNKILEINAEDLYATVQPGVITAKFAAAVAAKGLFYPPDPGSMSVSTIGGNVAESSGGLRGLKYGTTKDYVMGLEVFANTGDLVKTGSREMRHGLQHCAAAGGFRRYPRGHEQGYTQAHSAAEGFQGHDGPVQGHGRRVTGRRRDHRGPCGALHAGIP